MWTSVLGVARSTAGRYFPAQRDGRCYCFARLGSSRLTPTTKLTTGPRNFPPPTMETGLIIIRSTLIQFSPLMFAPHRVWYMFPEKAGGAMYQAEWWTLYRAAVLETNAAEVRKLVAAARNAIEKRLLAGQISHQENAALQDARQALETLAAERF